MLLAGIVSEADILKGLLIVAGIWFVPPLLYASLIRWAVSTTDQPCWGLLLWPVAIWVLGLPSLIYVAGRASGQL